MMCRQSVRWVGWMAVAAWAVLASAPVAKADWKDDDAYKQLLKYEVKTLKGLMQSALKEDYRRQAWYFADRILAADPNHTQAIEVVEKWEAKELVAGQVPKKGWLKKRDQALRKLGDDYFHFGETLEAAGIDPVDYYPINVRASSYGSQAGPLVAAYKDNGYMWMHTWLEREVKEVSALLGPDLLGEVTYPPEFDDEFLKYRARWPEAKVATWGRWRFVTDLEYLDALRLVALVADAERWLIKKTGMHDKKGDTITDLLIFKDLETYDKIGVDLVRDEDREDFSGSSGWYRRSERVAMVPAKHRHNAWVATDSVVLRQAMRVLVRRHLAAGLGGWVRGRGFWVMDGLAGSLADIQRSDEKKSDGFVLNAQACWELAAARSLRDGGTLMSWNEFFDLNYVQAEKIEKQDLTIHVNGAAREALSVDVVNAQAVALAAGVWLSHPKKGPKAIAALIQAVVKRDSLPDVDKTMKFKKGGAVKEADRAMDAVVKE